MEHNSVQKNIDLLVNLQSVDTELYKIEKLKGSLPVELKNLENELASINETMNQLKMDIANLEQMIINSKISIKDHNQIVDKYIKQQISVKGNREYDAITKEIELNQLEVKLLEKKMKGYHLNIEEKDNELKHLASIVGEKKKNLESKKQELESIVKEQEKNQLNLIKDKEGLSSQLDSNLLKVYSRILESVSNGAVVVYVSRNACNGCFNLIPFQVQMEIEMKDKIIFCEHCGRILAGVVHSY
jgi:predicted  nucleic acid-binding Zn-ribbon protein